MIITVTMLLLNTINTLPQLYSQPYESLFILQTLTLTLSRPDALSDSRFLLHAILSHSPSPVVLGCQGIQLPTGHDASYIPYRLLSLILFI